MAVLSLDRLSKRFGARLAVDAVSFEVQEREVAQTDLVGEG